MKAYRTMKQHELAKLIGVRLPVETEAGFESIMSKVSPTLQPKLKAAIELYKRSLEATAPKYVKASSDVIPIFRPLLSDLETEDVWAMFIRPDSSIIKTEKVHHGGFGSCPIDIKYIATRCLEERARSLIIAHNHPGGRPVPSPSDTKHTTELKKALLMLDVLLLDHIIVARGGDCYSFADEVVTKR